MKENVFFVLVFSPSYQYWVPEHNNETLKFLRHRGNEIIGVNYIIRYHMINKFN
jgi:hypothetical protein